MTELHSNTDFLQIWWVELLCGLVIIVIVPPIAAYFALAERKLAEDMQVDPRPTIDDPEGLLQQIAATVKRLLKKETIPEIADEALFQLAPIVSFAAALIALAAIAFGPGIQVVRDSNIGLLFVLGISSLGCFGIFFGAWALRSENASIAAMHATARFVTFQIAAVLALISGIFFAGTLRVQVIVDAQQHDAVWYLFLAPISFVLFVVASLVGADRDFLVRPEVESEFGDTRSERGFRWTLYLIAGYTNRIVTAAIATTIFLGGWLRPFSSVHWLNWLDAFRLCY